MVFRRRARRSDPTTVASLFDPSKIDLITSERGGAISLIVIQDQPWLHTAEELQSLTDKINNYVEAAAGGQLAASYPQSAGRPWRIVIDTYTGPPSKSALASLAQVRQHGRALLLRELQPPAAGEKVPVEPGLVQL